MYGPIVCHLRQLSGMIIPEIESTFHDSKHGSKASILRQRGTQIQLHGQRSSMLALIAMGVTFTLCLLPYLYLYISSVSQFSVPPWVDWLAYIMFILQTNSNPFLYAWLIPEIRELCFKFRRMESNNIISRWQSISNFSVEDGSQSPESTSRISIPKIPVKVGRVFRIFRMAAWFTASCTRLDNILHSILIALNAIRSACLVLRLVKKDVFIRMSTLSKIEIWKGKRPEKKIH